MAQRRKRPDRKPDLAAEAAELDRQGRGRQEGAGSEQPWVSLEGLAELAARAEEAERQAALEAEAAHERVIVAARAFHDAVQGARAAVLAQFGPDSPQYLSLRRRRRTDRRRSCPKPSSES